MLNNFLPYVPVFIQSVPHLGDMVQFFSNQLEKHEWQILRFLKLIRSLKHLRWLMGCKYLFIIRVIPDLDPWIYKKVSHTCTNSHNGAELQIGRIFDIISEIYSQFCQKPEMCLIFSINHNLKGNIYRGIRGSKSSNFAIKLLNFFSSLTPFQLFFFVFVYSLLILVPACGLSLLLLVLACGLTLLSLVLAGGLTLLVLVATGTYFDLSHHCGEN